MGLYKRVVIIFLSLLIICIVFNVKFLNDFENSTIVNKLESKSSNSELFAYFKMEHGEKIMQDNKNLIKQVKDKMLFRPEKVQNSLTKTSSSHQNNLNKSDGLIKFLFRENILERKKGGFFVEVGTNDGEQFTSTRVLEDELYWNGLLIEGALTPFKNLLKQNRSVWHTNAVISSKPHCTTQTFYENPQFDLVGGLTFRFYKKTSKGTPTQTYPLATFLFALNVFEIDLLILDIDGTETDVLRTLPLNTLKIDVIVVELLNNKESPTPAKKLLFSKGYVLVEKIMTDVKYKLKKRTKELELDESTEEESVRSAYYIFKLNNKCKSYSYT